MSNDGYKNCPYCDEEIKAVAVKCRYCESLLYDINQITKKPDSIIEINGNKQFNNTAKEYQYLNQNNKINKIVLVFGISIPLIFGGFLFLNSFINNEDISLLQTDSDFADDTLEDGKEILTDEQEADNAIEIIDTTEISGIDSDDNALDIISEEEEDDESTIAYGTISWNGGTYSGPLENVVPQGWGNWSDPTGKTYTGDFINGKMTGYGTLIFPGGEEYVGYFKDGLGHGQGKMTHPDGRSVSGLWVEGVYQGN